MKKLFLVWPITRIFPKANCLVLCRQITKIDSKLRSDFVTLFGNTIGIWEESNSILKTVGFRENFGLLTRYLSECDSKGLKLFFKTARFEPGALRLVIRAMQVTLIIYHSLFGLSKLMIEIIDDGLFKRGLAAFTQSYAMIKAHSPSELKDAIPLF